MPTDTPSDVVEDVDKSSVAEVDDEADEKVDEKVEECCVCSSAENVRRCSGCHATSYCSRKCQKSHHAYHAPYCSAINQLEKFEINKLYRGFSVRQQQLDAKTQTKLVKLVGEKPILRCLLDGKSVDVLWDTGSMITLVSRKWAKENFPNKKIHSITEFLEENEEELHVTAANKTEVKIEGVILLDFSLDASGVAFPVPVLVGTDDVEPILGYNVIKHLVLKGSSEQQKGLEASLQRVTASFRVESLAQIVESESSNPDFLTDIKSPSSFKVPAGTRMQIKCRVKATSNGSEQTAYFSPRIAESDDDLTFSETVSKLRRGRTNHVVVDVMNLSSKDKFLKKGTFLGSMHSVAAVIPMVGLFNVQKKQKGKVADVQVGAVETEVKENDMKSESKDLKPEDDGDGEKKEKTWDLSHLQGKQREMMEKVLKEAEGVFSKDDADIGDVPEFQMPIHLEDNIPVTEAYRRIPPHLYQEVRNYIEDLRNNGWVRESFSSYE